MMHVFSFFDILLMIPHGFPSMRPRACHVKSQFLDRRHSGIELFPVLCLHYIRTENFLRSMINKNIMLLVTTRIRRTDPALRTVGNIERSREKTCKKGLRRTGSLNVKNIPGLLNSF